MAQDFLTKIVADKLQSVAAAKRQYAENRLREASAQIPSRRPFASRLAQGGMDQTNIIAEIKRASPSKGIIREDLVAAEYARYYEAGGAAAISVLTDAPYFKGSIDDLKAARAATRLPVLRKDFTVSTYQIYESAVIEADAILLIVRILSPSQLKEYLHLSRELALDALVEVHSEADLEIATEVGATLIGINNRNLSSFDTDINTAMRMKALLTKDQIPVAASGISNREDILQNRKLGIYNFLIGESLVRAGDTVEFLNHLREI